MRIALAIVGFIGVVALPFWVPLLCAVVLAVRYRAWEVILLGLFMDFVWMPSTSFFHFLPICTAAAIILVWALEPLRKEFLAR